MKILLKMTSRNRAHQCQQTLISWILNAENPDDIRIAYSLDVDDPHKYLYRLSAFPGHVSLAESRNKIEAINRGVPDDEWDILVNVSDDQKCVMKNWDTELKKLFSISTDMSVWAPDGVQNRINTQEIIGREYYNRFGFIYDPRFKSFFCDNLSTEVAEFLGKQVKVDKPFCRHDHQAASHIQLPMDEVAKKNQKYWDEDQLMYNELKSGGLTNYLVNLKHEPVNINSNNS